MVEIDHLVAQPLADRNEDFLRLVALLVFDRIQFLETRQTRLRLGLARLGILPHPFQFLLHGLDAADFLLGLGFQPRLLLLQPAGVVALPRNAVAAVEFENPLGGVVEEIAIVRHRHHGAGVAHQELLQPVDRLGVEVVGRLVEQQHVGIGQQQLAQRDTALFAARQIADHRVPRRQSQRVGGDFHLRVEVGAGGGENRLAARLLLGQLVEIGIGLGIGGVDFIEPVLGRNDLAQPRFHRLRAPCASGRAAAPAAGSRCGCPASGWPRPRCPCRRPAMMRISEDLPEPLRPSRPILAPGKKLSEMSFRICRLGGTILPTRLRE